jgi:hypothetical protein
MFIKAATAVMHVYKLLSTEWDIVFILENFVLLYLLSFCALVREFSVARFAHKHSCCFVVLIIIGSLGYMSGFVRL